MWTRLKRAYLKIVSSSSIGKLLIYLLGMTSPSNSVRNTPGSEQTLSRLCSLMYCAILLLRRIYAAHVNMRIAIFTTLVARKEDSAVSGRRRRKLLRRCVNTSTQVKQGK